MDKLWAKARRVTRNTFPWHEASTQRGISSFESVGARTPTLFLKRTTRPNLKSETFKNASTRPTRHFAAKPCETMRQHMRKSRCAAQLLREPSPSVDVRNRQSLVSAMDIPMSVEFHREGDWFVAFCPEFPEANGQGKTREECLQSLREAILLLLEDRRETVAPRGEP